MLDELKGPEAEAAWLWFVERYRPMIGSLLRLHLDGPRAAAALSDFWGYLFSSNVFGRATRNRRFRSFLSGVVRNYARSWLRAHRTPSARGEEVLLQAAMTEEDLGAQELRVWSRHLVELGLRALDRGHADQARALRWFYGIPAVGEADAVVEPVAVAEIARRLDRKVNAVHQILHRGRARLRACIEAELRATVADAAEVDEEMRLLSSSVHVEAPGLLG